MRPMLSLPTLPAAAMPVATTVPGALAVAGTSGALALATSALMVPLFRRISPPELKDSSVYLTHKLISLVFMVVASAIGVAGLLLAPSLTPLERLLEPSGSGRFLSAMLLGELVLYELPWACVAKELRKTDMIVHHVAMAVVTLCGALWIPFHYCLFYLGVAELSSIPLQLSETVAHLRSTARAATGRLARLDAVTSALTMAAFVCVRGVLFTKVTLTQFLPDILLVLRAPGAALTPSMRLLLCLAIPFSLGFTALQLFWLARGARDALRPRDASTYGLRGRRTD